MQLTTFLRPELHKGTTHQLVDVSGNIFNDHKIVKINIKTKDQVGSDRIANAVGVYKRYKSNCIVLDFGTATTFDVVTKTGTYNGGIIAPGVNLSLKSLVNSAEQIPIFSIKRQKKIIGKNTIEALRSGFYWGYLGLINNIILNIERETKNIFVNGNFKFGLLLIHTVDGNNGAPLGSMGPKRLKSRPPELSLGVSWVEFREEFDFNDQKLQKH